MVVVSKTRMSAKERKLSPFSLGEQPESPDRRRKADGRRDRRFRFRPAYVFHFIEALTAYAAEQRERAGPARLLRHADRLQRPLARRRSREPGVLRQRVTSPKRNDGCRARRRDGQEERLTSPSQEPGRRSAFGRTGTVSPLPERQAVTASRRSAEDHQVRHAAGGVNHCRRKPARNRLPCRRDIWAYPFDRIAVMDAAASPGAANACSVFMR